MRDDPGHSNRETAAGPKLSKTLPLGDAIRRHIRPGMTIHLAAGIGGPSAAVCELIRQFKATDPNFTVVQSTMSGHALNLVHCGVVKRLICAACIDISDSSRPSKIIQRALADHEIELKNWSLCSLQQRLMAGAFGFPFIPTRSVIGSSIAGDHPDSFRIVEDPFDATSTFGVVKSLNPDISIVHACAADEEGNLILSAPYGDDIWGSFASTGGVLATVEAIVPGDIIRKYAALVKIPGYLVKSVSVAPFGAHPFSLTNPGIDEFVAYEKDTEFLKILHKSSSDKTALEEWLKVWVEDCANHEQYLEKLGSEKLAALKYSPTGKRESFSPVTAVAPQDIVREVTDEEMMLVMVAREVHKSVRKNGHSTILAGAGTGATAAWLAYYQLKAEGYNDIELITGNGLIGYSPLPGQSVLSSEAGVRTAKFLTDTVTTHGVLVGGKNGRCLSVLGAGQVDKYGNINSTKTASGAFLVGSGGGNDAVNAREVIVTLKQSKDRFAETLSFITGRGDAVTTVVSTMGVFKKSGAGEGLVLQLKAVEPH
ncbi:MAG TPA: CoA-transferase [Syntrophorhabdaceae bacterium]|nr:CoA-transferase [Syntrophorhabdaceae bacterium]